MAITILSNKRNLKRNYFKKKFYSYIPDMSTNDHFNWFVSLMALSSGTISAVVHQVPNQPVYYWNDPSLKKRVEDAVISWTWKMFMENVNKPEWILFLPMTKVCFLMFKYLKE